MAVATKRNFATRLALARQAANVSQRDLAKALGVTQGGVSGWENEQATPDPETVFAIERRLGLPPGHLSASLGYLPLPPTNGRVKAPDYRTAITEIPDIDDQAKLALIKMIDATIAAIRMRRPRRPRG